MTSDTTELMRGRGHTFDATSWTLVRGGAHDGKALDTLLSIYWKPLYFFVRQKGYSNEDAKDVVQEFLRAFHERRAVLRADPARGKFRTYLLACVTNFLSNREAAARAQKRGGGRIVLSGDLDDPEEEFQRLLGRGETPEESLDRAWARNLWEQCLAELGGDPLHLEAFRLRSAGKGYQEIAESTGLSVAAAKSAVDRLRARLRESVVAYLRPGTKTAEELRAEILRFKGLLL